MYSLCVFKLFNFFILSKYALKSLSYFNPNFKDEMLTPLEL